MKHQFNIPILLILLLGACNKQEDKLLSLDFSNLDSLVCTEQSVDFSSLFSSVKSYNIPEIQEPIGDVYTVSKIKTGFIISASNGLLFYNSNTGQMNKIGAVGRGPNEYLSCRNVVADSSGEQLYFLDFVSQKIMSFHPDGTFIACYQPSLKNHHLITGIFIEHNDLYLFSQNNSIFNELYIYNKENGNLLIVSQNERELIPGEGIASSPIITGCDHKFMYNHFNDTVYRVSSKGLSPEYLISNGNLRVPADRYKLINSIGKSSGQSYLGIKNIIDCSQYILVEYTAKPVYVNRFAFYHKKQNRMYYNCAFSFREFDNNSVDYKIFSSTNDNEVLIWTISDFNTTGENKYYVFEYKV